jgi:hypothetical protein
MARNIAHTRISPLGRFTSKFRYLFLCTSLLASLLTSITAGITPASAVITNPTPTCSGATCVINFTSTNDYYAWNAPVAGTYTFEVWGGQGGTPSALTGKGGYAKGNKVMTAGTTLYVYVGGSGTWTNKGIGGYNGGGNGALNEVAGGGGGATHIASAVGLLSTLSGNQASVLLVAGGGGGGDDASLGGAGGGTAGLAGTSNATHKGRQGLGATQTAGACATGQSPTSAWKVTCGVFGLGGVGTNNYGAGGGGGWYGGGGAEYDAGGGGGSGYVGGVTTTTLTAGDATMPNPAGGTMTGRTGVGYARVTYPNGPAVSTFTSTQTTPTNTVNAISYSLTMSEIVTGMANADFSNSGTATGCAFSVAGSGSSYTLTVSSCSEGTLIPQLLANSILGSSTGQNGPASNSPATSTITIDRTAPSISSITAPANATYIPAGQINFTANMSEAVTVTGTPRIAITVGTTTRYANYVSGTGTASLVFRYTVATDLAEIDTDGIVATSPIELNSGTMADAATNVSARTFTPPTMSNVLVAQAPGAPTISSISTSSGALSVAFTAGAINGSAITNYQYSLNSGAWNNRQTGTTASPIAITGLTNGTAYTVAIRAVNAAGAGTASTTSVSVTVNPPLAMVTPSTLTTSYGTPTSVTLTSTNGTGAKSYAIRRTSDSSQVSGITLVSSTGVVSVSSSTLPGTYGMTATVTDAANATASTNFNIVVNAATLVIAAASPATIFYGGTKASDTFTVTGLNAADSITGLTYTYSGTGSTIYGPTPTAPTAAGTYAITPSAVTFVGGATTAAKYSNITYTPASFEIAKKALTVTPTNQDIVYGATAAISFGVTGFIAGESDANAAGYTAPTCVVSTYSVTSITGSTHAITCSGGLATNYSFSPASAATATVVKATLSVVPDAKSVNYGSAAPTLTFNVNGFRNLQTAANAAGYSAPTCSSSYTTTSVAGTPVAITCSGGLATNYTFNTSATASITIAKLGTLTITAGSPSAINYGGTTPANSFSASGKATNDVISGVSYSYSGTSGTSYGPSASAPTLPGDYLITPDTATFSTGAGSNYTTISYVAGTWKINAATLVIAAASPATIFYGGTKASDTFTVTGLNASDSITGLTYTYSGTGSTIYGPTPTAPTAAGTYAITPSAVTFVGGATTAAKYSISYTPASFEIAKKALTVTPTNQDIVYGATAAISFGVTGFIAGESDANAAGYTAPTCVVSTYSVTSITGSTHAITCSGGLATNYSFSPASAATATVVKATLSVVPDAKSVNYGSAAPTLTFNVNGFRNLQTAANAAGYSAPTCSSSYTTTSVAGTPVAITCSGGLATNYTFNTSATASITIAKLGTLTITAGSPSAINYGGTTPANSFSASGKATNDVISGVSYSYSGTSGTSYGPSASAPTLPGDYLITPDTATFSTGAGSNYTTISYVAGTWKINAATLVIAAASPATIFYGGTKASDTFTVTGLNASDSITSLTYTYSGTGSTIYGPTLTAPTAAGTYAITPSAVTFVGGATTAAKYSNITYTPASFEIAKKALTVTPTNQDIVYGATAAISFGVTGFIAGESDANAAGYTAPTCVVSTYSVTSITGSTHAITCSGGLATNYSFSPASAATATVVKATLSVVPDAKSVNYGSAAPTLTFNVNGFRNSQTAANAAGYSAPTCSSSYTTTSVAGTPVAITCSGGLATNYTFNTSATASITIAKLGTLTITAGSPSAINYGGTTPANSFSASGKATNDVISGVSYSYSGTSGTSYGPSASAPTLPGDYLITPDTATFSTGAGSNYTTISYVAGTWKINAATLVIAAASPATIFYGGTKASDTFTVTGLNASDSITGLTYTYSGTGSTIYGPTLTAPTAAGTYAITPSAVTFVGGATTAAKYSNITYTPASFEIAKKALTVTPTNQDIVYGATAAISFGVTGFIAGESDANAAGYTAPTCVVSTYSVTSITGSTHAITCSGGLATNYSFSPASAATATVVKATLSVVPDAKSVNYGSAAPTLTFNVNGFRNSQTAANAAGYSAPTCSSSYTTTSVAGTPVAITCSGGLATNYTFNTSATASITIAKLGTLTITAGSPSAINYGGTTPANSFSASGKATNDVISGVSYSYSGTSGTSYGPSASAPTLPGDYLITPDTATFSTGAGSNYTTISYVAGTWKINKAALTIAASTASGLVYGSNSLVILGANGTAGSRSANTEFSLDNGSTWSAAYLGSSQHPWGNFSGTNNWLNCAAELGDPACLGSGGNPKTVKYRTKFSLPSVWSSPSMTVRVNADNNGTVYLNGTMISSPNFAGSTTFTPSVTSILVSGENILVFDIADSGGLAGFNYRVDLTISSNSNLSVNPGYSATNLNAADSITGLTYTYSGTGSTIYGPTLTAPTAAGTYAITPSAVTFVGGATTAAKYSNITYTPASFEIAKKALTVTPTNQDIVYGATAAISFGVTGFIAGESDANAAGYTAPTCVVSTYSVTSITGSTHAITCSGGLATNYSFSPASAATATVVKATLSVVPDAKSVNYGSAAPTLTFNVNGFRNSQTAANAAGYSAPTCSSSYTTTSVAGTPVAITCSGGLATNYTFNTSATASITIAKLGTLTITAGSPSAINYGGTTPANSFSASGKATNDVISGVSYSYSGTSGTSYGPSASAPTLPGDYLITPDTATFSTGAGSNYTTISYVAGTWKINKAGLVVTVTPQTGVTYGSTITETFTVTGLNAADSITGLTYTYSGTGSTIYGPTSTAPKAVGTYALTPSAVVFANVNTAAKYASVSYSSGSISIVKAALQLVPDTVTVVYGSALPTLTFTVTGLQYTDSLSSLTGYVSPTCSSTYTLTTQVALSPVSITCSGGSASNYTFTSGSVNGVTITKRPLTISGTSIATRAYNGTASPGSVTVGTVSGYATGETLPISASAANYSSESTGTYSTTVTYTLSNNADSSKGLANNYSVGTSTVSGQIIAAQPGFNVSISQGALPPAFAINYGSSETLTITATTATAGTINFKVSVNGGTASDISGCSAVTISSGAAVCPWVNPTVGKIRITISLTPTNANEAVDPKTIDTIVVARPFITLFYIRNQEGVTSGPPGSVVVIKGGNFTGITDIKFGSVSAEKTFRASATQATVTVPFGAQTGPITITTLLGGSGVSTTNFSVNTVP